MNPKYLTSTKVFHDYPCSHRQHKHDGHCAFVHGYSRSFHFVFACSHLDECGFVVDFGKLKFMKAYLENMFDHTLLLNPDDPLIPEFTLLEMKGAFDLRVMKYGVGMEATAREVLEEMHAHLQMATKGRAWVVSLEVRENQKNSGFYFNPLVTHTPPFALTIPQEASDAGV